MFVLDLSLHNALVAVSKVAACHPQSMVLIMTFMILALHLCQALQHQLEVTCVSHPHLHVFLSSMMSHTHTLVLLLQG